MRMKIGCEKTLTWLTIGGVSNIRAVLPITPALPNIFLHSLIARKKNNEKKKGRTQFLRKRKEQTRYETYREGTAHYPFSYQKKKVRP